MPESKGQGTITGTQNDIRWVKVEVAGYHLSNIKLHTLCRDERDRILYKEHGTTYFPPGSLA